LKEIIKNQEKRTKVLFIIGTQGSGKTTLLSNLIDKFKNRGIRPAGILAPGYWSNGHRSGFDIVNIKTNEKAVLCNTDSDEAVQQIGQFYFKQKGIDLGKKALDGNNLENTDVFIIDEIGPLELRGEGWSKELEVLLNNNVNSILLTARESIFDKILEIWSIKPEFVHHIGDGEFDENKMLNIIKNNPVGIN
jgi:nucleoside-triphosphatase THEP1